MDVDYVRVVIFFDFGNPGDGATYLFDDVRFGPGGLSLPITFDATGVAYPFGDFGGAGTELVADPANGALRVAQTTKGAGAETFAGTVTNGIGYFEISVAQGDTIVFSNVGYQFKYLAIDSAVISKIKEERLIKLVPKNFLLDEVSIYAITSNNPRTMPQAKPRVPGNADIRILRSSFTAFA